MRTLLTILLAATTLMACAGEQQLDVDAKAEARSISSSQGSASQAEPSEKKDADEGSEYCDADGGTWTFYPGDDMFSGRYERKDADGNVTQEGDWAQNTHGEVAYDSDGGGTGTLRPTDEGYSYDGFTDDGEYEKGSIDVDC